MLRLVNTAFMPRKSLDNEQKYGIFQIIAPVTIIHHTFDGSLSSEPWNKFSIG